MKSPVPIALSTLLLLPLFAGGADPIQWTTEFHSGFEPGVVGSPKEAHDRITGRDKGSKQPGDWEKDLVDGKRVGKFWIQYQGGTPVQRYAKIVEDPTDKSNRVLKFWLAKANVKGDKGRIQAVVSDTTDFKKFRTRVRLRLSEDFRLLEKAPAPIKWLTIQEYWNNAHWGDEKDHFRVTFNFQKPEKKPGHPLRFGAHGQTRTKKGKWKNVWETINRDVAVPIGEWFTLETTFIEGDKETGRFTIRIEQKDGKPQTVIDVRDFTHHPDARKPDGVRQLNPMKLYTSGKLLKYVEGKKGVLQLFWDDFELALAD